VRSEVRAGPLSASGALWEAIVIEGLAQTACVLNGHHDRGIGRSTGKGMLVEVRKFKVERVPEVGECVDYRVDLIKRLLPLVLVQGEARVGADVIAAGELKFFVEEA